MIQPDPASTVMPCRVKSPPLVSHRASYAHLPINGVRAHNPVATSWRGGQSPTPAVISACASARRPDWRTHAHMSGSNELLRQMLCLPLRPGPDRTGRYRDCYVPARTKGAKSMPCEAMTRSLQGVQDPVRYWRPSNGNQRSADEVQAHAGWHPALHPASTFERRPSPTN